MTRHDLLHALDAQDAKLSLSLVADSPRGEMAAQGLEALAAYKSTFLA
jgi:hypothetical protein